MMKNQGTFFVFLFAVFFLCGCAVQRASEAVDAQRALVGKTKEQVFSCMGPARRKDTEGKTEIWVYRSSNDYVEKGKNRSSASNKHYWGGDDTGDLFSGMLGYEHETIEKRYCDIHIIFRDERVKNVNYAGPTGGIFTQDEQCAFATRNCM